MLIAGSVDLGEVLLALASRRPVFHSEADLQLALAWEVKLRDPDMDVFLETRPAPGVHLDLAFKRPDPSRPDLMRYTAIELKYLTRAWLGDDQDERYELKSHGAQDIRAYDIVKDIVRVESFASARPGSNGAVIVIANDPNYWRPIKPADTFNAAAFRVGEGAVITGSRAWGPNTGPGTKIGRDEVLNVRGRYEMHWSDYSTVRNETSECHFRQLVIEVRGVAAEEVVEQQLSEAAVVRPVDMGDRGDDVSDSDGAPRPSVASDDVTDPRESPEQTPFRILQEVLTLHERGWQNVRVLPGVSPSGMHWRVEITNSAVAVTARGEEARHSSSIFYTTGDPSDLAGAEVTEKTSPETIAHIVLHGLHDPVPAEDPEYVAWFAELMRRVKTEGQLPVAYADYFDGQAGWEIGWGSGVRYPHPPPAGRSLM